MSARINLAGQVFGHWKVVSYSGLNKLGQPCWRCLCDCGVERDVVGQTLRDGRSVSCGCAKPAAISKARTTHGQSVNKTREYKAWAAMRARVNPKNKTNWKWYAKYGITVCGRWNYFSNFLSDMGKCPEGWTLDRIDPSKNYEPSNCRWADWHTQRINQRRDR